MRCKCTATKSTIHKVQKLSSMYFNRYPQFKRERGRGGGEEEEDDDDDDDEDLNQLCYLHQNPSFLYKSGC
jgi:hypothetical protein